MFGREAASSKLRAVVRSRWSPCMGVLASPKTRSRCSRARVDECSNALHGPCGVGSCDHPDVSARGAAGVERYRHFPVNKDKLLTTVKPIELENWKTGQKLGMWGLLFNTCIKYTSSTTGSLSSSFRRFARFPSETNPTVLIVCDRA